MRSVCSRRFRSESSQLTYDRNSRTPASRFDACSRSAAGCRTSGLFSPRRPTTSRPLNPRLAEQRLEGTDLDGVKIIGKFGEGRRSIVYRAIWQGRDIALKVYKGTGHRNPRAQRHSADRGIRVSPRNSQIHAVPGLDRYVAQPLAWVVSPEVQAVAQEPVDGPLYYFFYRKHDGELPPSFAGHLREILRLSHGAELYDVDLHAMNVLVSAEASGELVPKLFDFNLIPFTQRPQNPLVGWLLSAGVLSRQSRDRRRLRRFHHFNHIENRLLKFYRQNPG